MFKQKEYNLLLSRLYDNGNDTLGMLYYKDLQENVRYVFTLEDEYREVKKYGETRIPSGKYEIRLRKEGKFYDKYSNHKNEAIKQLTRKYGMLHIVDVPQYEYVLIHIGNDEDDTAGCILVGNNPDNNSTKTGWIANSTEAYIFFVSAIYAAMERGEIVYINIFDNDREIVNQFRNS